MESEISLNIDIEKAIKKKAPGAGRKIPRFVYRLLARLICQERLNWLLHRNAQRQGVDFADGVLSDLNVSVRLEGAENIPAEGRFIFASNHPLGGLDGMALIKLFGERFDKRVRFVVNDLLMNIPNLTCVFVPINKHGSQGKENAALLGDAFASDNQILIFPAGLCSRLQGGRVCDLEWKKAVITKAVETERDVIPLFFEGHNSPFFYRLALWRKRLGIKANIEMALLPREMFKNAGSSFTVHVGKPIPWQTFDKSRSPRQWAEYLKKTVYDLQQK
jgi:putative hemolysin